MNAALAALSGRPQRYSGSLQLDVRLIDAAVRRCGIASSLRDALEQLDGPIAPITANRRELERHWWRVIETRPPDIPIWAVCSKTPAAAVCSNGSPDRTPRRAELCRCAAAVLRHLPAKGMTRSQLAASVLGDAHALDNGQAVATLVLAVRRSQRCRGEDEDDRPTGVRLEGLPEPPGNTERAREIWARAGVLVNELDARRCFLNLPTCGVQPAGWRRGEPAYLSLRCLLRSPPVWDVGGRKVYVCENPNLLAIAADQWGTDCAPLVCTDGMPAAAQRCLLSSLRRRPRASATMATSIGQDWIGNYVMSEYGAAPWRFGAADYLAAVPMAPRFGGPLRGTPVDASWTERRPPRSRHVRSP